MPNPETILYTAMAGFAGVVGVVWWWRRRTSNRSIAWHCDECGRDLRGLRLPVDREGVMRCPVCAAPFDPPMRITH